MSCYIEQDRAGRTSRNWGVIQDLEEALTNESCYVMKELQKEVGQSCQKPKMLADSIFKEWQPLISTILERSMCLAQQGKSTLPPLCLFL